jgi:hypothetical protein
MRVRFSQGSEAEEVKIEHAPVFALEYIPFHVSHYICEQVHLDLRRSPPVLSKSDPGILELTRPRRVMATMEHHDAEGPEEAM